MRTALITTTINVPTVLQLYRKLDPSVKFYVAADEKTPDEAYQFCADIPDCEIYSPDRQKELGYECSELLGWGTVRRRNIMLLEALKQNADIVVTIDTDNFPMQSQFFSDIQELLTGAFTGVEITSESGWVDPGWLIHPPVAHRGMPVRLPQFHTAPISAGRIGVVSCTVLGSCDLAAVDRLAATLVEGQPKRHLASELARSGTLVNPDAHHTVFNTQATAFIGKIAPAIFCAPGIGRHDDICASIIMQRIMCNFELHVHMGRPIVWHEHQDRSEKVIVRNVEEELWGHNNFSAFVDAVFDVDLGYRSTLDALAHLWTELAYGKFVPEQTSEAALAFIRDAKKIL